MTELTQLPDDITIPNHLAVIVDGNRRWAQKNKRKYPWLGHRVGVKNINDFLKWCLEAGVPKVSVYALSTENLNRPDREVEELFNLFYKYLEDIENDESKVSKLLNKYEVKIKFIGDLEKLPPKMRKLMGKIMAKTAKHQKKALNLLIAYGSKFELTETVKKIAQSVLDKGKVEITPKDIDDNLMVSSPVDLIIRTGGRHRLSNLLLWQSAYAELYVTDTLWPDFDKDEFIRALKWFDSIKRNFGK